jgi:ATP-dependent Clp protease ATP-binding subunit ClpA
MGIFAAIRSFFKGYYADSPMTDAAKSVMQSAQRAAKGLGHEYIGVEHLVLGILSCDSWRQVRLARQRIVPGPEMVTMGRLPHSDGCEQAIAHAINLASSENESLVDVRHLRAGVFLAEPQTVARLTGVDPAVASPNESLRVTDYDPR